MLLDWKLALTIVFPGAYMIFALWRIRAWLRPVATKEIDYPSDGTESGDRTVAASAVLETAPQGYDIQKYVRFGKSLHSLAPTSIDDSTQTRLLSALSRTGDALVVQMKKLDQSPIMLNESLKMRAYLNGQFTTQFPVIADSVRSSDYQMALEQSEMTRKYILSLGKIRENWEYLRVRATKCILNEQEAMSFSSSFEELSHLAPFPIEVPRTGMRYGWNTWRGLMAPSRQMSSMAELIRDLLHHEDIKADIVCQLSVSASSFSNQLANLLDVEHHAMDTRSFSFLPNPPMKGRHYILVDSMIRTGLHLQRACDAIYEAGAFVEKAVFVVRNDLLPAEDAASSWAKGSIRRAGMMMHLFTVSDLIQCRASLAEAEYARSEP